MDGPFHGVHFHGTLSAPTWHAQDAGENPRTAGARRALMDLYDGEIHWCDQHIRKSCEELSALSNDVIIVSSDHGEEFLEHDNIGHGENLFETTIRVPLLVRFPDR